MLLDLTVEPSVLTDWDTVDPEHYAVEAVLKHSIHELHALALRLGFRVFDGEDGLWWNYEPRDGLYLALNVREEEPGTTVRITVYKNVEGEDQLDPFDYAMRDKSGELPELWWLRPAALLKGFVQ